MKIVYYKNPESEYQPQRDIVFPDDTDVIVKCFDCENELSYIKENHPDIIVFEKSAMPFAVSVFYELISSEKDYSPKVLVYHPNEKTVDLNEYEPEKPFGKFDIVDAVESEYDCVDDDGKHDITAIISGILSEFGIPAHISGYRYLKKAVLISLYNSSAMNTITKDIYPAIERHFRVSRGTAERAMRHAIESVWDKSDMVFIRLYFSRRKKPSNSLFISLVSENIRNHYESEIQREIEIIESCRRYARRKKKRGDK